MLWKNEKNNIACMKQCPRFLKCSVPICPLDFQKDERMYLCGEEKCTLGKTYRKKYGAGLPWKGLFPKELGGIKAWRNRDEKSRVSTLENLASGRSKNPKSSGSVKKGGEVDV